MSIYVIAEGGVNHNGQIKAALEMVDLAAAAGADAVKFQVFKSENLVTGWAPKADYQNKTTDSAQSQLDMLRKLELHVDDYDRLKERCAEQQIELLVSPFDLPGIDFLADTLNLRALKIPSGEITNGPFLLRAARTGLDIILSTGMSEMDEVATSLDVLAYGYTHSDDPKDAEDIAAARETDAGSAALHDHVSLLHCTSQYPTPYEDVNLNGIITLRDAFGLRTGLSDHTPGISVSVAAAGMGAQLIEKHFTLDKNLPGPDHQASLSPEELISLVSSLRQVSAAMGDGRKTIQPSEMNTRDIARRSLVASRPIKQGEIFTADNVTAKRPDGGLSPMRFWEVAGSAAPQDFDTDDPITLAES
jgi:N-acetylneuraminate synthase